jgi:HEAT repeat protein
LYTADKQFSAAFQALAESATTDPSASVRVSAVRALVSVGPEAAPTLAEVLKTETDPTARRDAAAALEDFARAGRDADGGLGKGCQ